jgi:RHS repeat-associated protein
LRFSRDTPSRAREHPPRKQAYFSNALGQRITIATGTTTQVQFYSMAGQVVETDQVGTGGSLTPVNQYVWGLDYVNALVETDSNASSGSLGYTSSGLGQRVFAMTDANYDIIAAADTGGAVLEKFDYDPYGARTVTLNASELSGSVTDTLGLAAGFQGGIEDAVTGLVHFDERDDNTLTGRWETQDPAVYVNGPDRYAVEGDDSSRFVDPTGLAFIVGTVYVASQPNGSAYVGTSFNVGNRLTDSGHTQADFLNDSETQITARSIVADTDGSFAQYYRARLVGEQSIMNTVGNDPNLRLLNTKTELGPEKLIEYGDDFDVSLADNETLVKPYGESFDMSAAREIDSLMFQDTGDLTLLDSSTPSNLCEDIDLVRAECISEGGFVPEPPPVNFSTVDIDSLALGDGPGAPVTDGLPAAAAESSGAIDGAGEVAELCFDVLEVLAHGL